MTDGKMRARRKNYIQDKKLKNLLSKRNTSILAHGLKPVSKDEYNQLYKRITKYAEETIPNLKQILKDSKHMKMGKPPSLFK